MRAPGAVVAAGEPILDVVPLDEPPIVEARVSPLDVDDVRIDQTARVVLTAFGRRAPLRLVGTVQAMSADSLVDPRTGEAYFLARIAVATDGVPDAVASVAMRPGMPVEVLIETGEHTFLAYLLQPIRDGLRRSFRDR